jgi:hypothetical protein
MAGQEPKKEHLRATDWLGQTVNYFVSCKSLSYSFAEEPTGLTVVSQSYSYQNNPS